MRDSTPERPWLVRAVDADDAPAGPVAEPRVGARLERKDAEKRIRRAKARRDVEKAERGLHPGCTHRGRRPKPKPAVVEELEATRAPANHDQAPGRAKGHRASGDPAGAPV